MFRWFKFTGKERDTESGLDYFGARYYASSMGRWVSPDPKAPNLKHLFNPQKWNKYNYVLNNPLSNIDPDGLEEITVQLRAYIMGDWGGDTVCSNCCCGVGLAGAVRVSSGNSKWSGERF